VFPLERDFVQSARRKISSLDTLLTACLIAWWVLCGGGSVLRVEGIESSEDSQGRWVLALSTAFRPNRCTNPLCDPTPSWVCPSGHSVYFSFCRILAERLVLRTRDPSPVD
ncbi:unnamed protein product, partial [Ectocarpus sp. 8 AP-2014]